MAPKKFWKAFAVMNDRRPTVLVTRPKQRAEEFASILMEHGCEVIHIPMIRIVPPESWAALDHALQRMDEFDGIIFTSANAVDFFYQRMNEISIGIPRRTRCYAVGEKTERTMHTHGIPCTSIPDSYNAASLAQSITDANGKRFLFPQSDIAREELGVILRTAGAMVEEIAVYRTMLPTDDAQAHLQSLLQSNIVDCISFFSPSSVINFLKLIPHFEQQDILLASIGETTAQTITQMGLRVDIVAPHATSPSLAAAIIERFITTQRV